MRQDVKIISVNLFEQKSIHGIDIIKPYKYQKLIFFRFIRKLLEKINMNKLLFNKKGLRGYKGNIILFDAVHINYVNWLVKHTNAKRYIFWYWNPVGYSINPNDIPKEYEVWTYSKSDAQKYNLKWNSTFLPFDILPILNEEVIYDAIFVGREKGRKNQLKELEGKINQAGYQVRNHLTKRNRMDFKNRKLPLPVSYFEYLKIENQGRVLIDFGLDNNVGMTLRALEALYYKKKIICNYKEILDSYIPRSNVFYFDNLDSFNKGEFLQFMSCPYEEVDNKTYSFYSFDNWLGRFFKD